MPRPPADGNSLRRPWTNDFLHLKESSSVFMPLSSRCRNSKTASGGVDRRLHLSLPKPFLLRRRRRRRGAMSSSTFEGGDLHALYFDNEEPHWVEQGRRDVALRRRRRRPYYGQPSSLDNLLTNAGRSWDFNAFTLNRLAQGDGLAVLCTHLFKYHGLLSTFKLDPLTVWRFFSLVESGYREGNPYHNGVHATDVTQAMNLFLQEPLIKGSLSPLELMSALIAAASHDLDHPGLNEKFLLGTQSHLAALYYEPECGSLLENHHWRSALSCMHQVGLSSALSSEDYAELSDLIKSSILATDIAKQGEYLRKLSKGIDEGDFQAPLDKDSRSFIVQIAMKCADISNPCRTWHISKLWSHRASEEFFRQGDKERELDLPLTPPFDRLSMTVAKIQTGFYRMVASPLFEEWNRFLGSTLSKAMMNNLVSNHARWDLIIQQEENKAPPQEVPTSEDEEESVAENPALDSLRRRFSLPLEECSSSSLRLGHKRRLFAEAYGQQRVSFQLKHSSLDETAGTVKVPKIFEENKENAPRRGSAPSDLLLNQLASLKQRRNSSSSSSSSSGSRTNESSSPPIPTRHARILKIDRRRGSLPVFSPSDFRRIEEELLTSSSSSSSSSKRTSSSSLGSVSNNNNNNSCSLPHKRKLLRRKSGGSETLIASEKSFLRRGSLRLGEPTRNTNTQRHILVSNETLLDELLKFSSGNIPPRVQILRGLSPALESELLQKFRTNLALGSPANQQQQPTSSNSAGNQFKRSPLSSSSNNSIKAMPRSKGRRGSLPTELLSFV